MAMLQAMANIAEVDVLQVSHGKTTTIERRFYGALSLVVVELAGSDMSMKRYEPKIQLTKEIENVLGHRMSSYDVIVGRYVWPVCQLNVPDSVPIVVDLDDWRFRYTKLLWGDWQMIKLRAIKWFAYHVNRRQLARFSAAWCVSEKDQIELSEMSVRVLPNVPRGPSARPTAVPDSGRILFVGSLWYQPNVAGVEWFLNKVWPRILQVRPATLLTLVGAASSAARARWQRHPGVNAPGFVSELDSEYEKASLVIVPIQFGGGSNIKLPEALKHGRPCLSTRFAHSAFANRLQSDKHLLVADNVDEFTRKALMVLSSPDSFQQMVDAGRRQVNESYNEQVFENQVVSVIQDVIASRLTPFQRFSW